MVMVGIIGGLASQMNDYAFLLALKKRYPSLSIKAVDGCFDHNGYELERVFGIHLDWAERRMAQPLVNFHIAPPGLTTKVFNAGHRIREFIVGSRKTHLNMVDYSNLDCVFPLDFQARDYVFWGNCRIETYQSVEPDLLAAFKFKRELTETNCEIAKRISEENSVAIHLRRGDYKKCGFALLGDEYYRAAVRAVSECLHNPSYFVFSDDIACAREMFRDLPRVTFVTGNRGNDSSVDMRLMSLCKHNITANSGFSMMAAWLNANKGKVVVAPKCPEEKDSAILNNWNWIQI